MTVTSGMTLPSYNEDGEQLVDDGVRTSDRKQYVHETSRPLGTSTIYVGEGDDVTDKSNVWGGEPLELIHVAGDNVLEPEVVADFNIEENESYVHEGYMTWKDEGSGLDCVRATLEIIPVLTPTTPGVNTNYTLYGPMIIPAAANGEIDINQNTMALVEMPLSMDTGLRDPGFWNADWDTSTKKFINLSSAAFDPDTQLPTGKYNMFVTEQILRRIVRIRLRHSLTHMLQAADSSPLGCNMRLRLKGETIGNDHNWDITVFLTMHRKKTI